MLTGAQLHAGRAHPGWTAEHLATASAVSIATIRRAEASVGALRLTAANQAALRSALEAGGIEFIDQNGGGPDARLQAPLP